MIVCKATCPVITDLRPHYQSRPVFFGSPPQGVHQQSQGSAPRVLAPRFSGDVQKPGNIWAQFKRWLVGLYQQIVNPWKIRFHQLLRRWRQNKQNAEVLETRQVVRPNVTTISFRRNRHPVLSIFNDHYRKKMVTSDYRIDKTPQGWQLTGKNVKTNQGFKYLIEPSDDERGGWLIKGRENGASKNWVFHYGKAASCYPNLCCCRGEKKEWFNITELINFSIRGAKGFFTISDSGKDRYNTDTNIHSHKVKRLDAAETDQGWQISFVDINDFVMNIKHNTTNPSHRMSGDLLLAILAILERLHVGT